MNDSSAQRYEHKQEAVPFVLGERRRIAVKVIDERGNELMRVLELKE